MAVFVGRGLKKAEEPKKAPAGKKEEVKVTPDLKKVLNTGPVKEEVKKVLEEKPAVVKAPVKEEKAGEEKKAVKPFAKKKSSGKK